MHLAARTGRFRDRRYRALVGAGVAGVLALAWVGAGQVTVAAASASAGTRAASVVDAATPTGRSSASAVPLTLPAELRFDTVADAAARQAVLDTRLRVLDTALADADAVVVASTGKVDDTLRAQLSAAVATLRSLRGERAHAGIPAATAAAVRLTAATAAAAAAHDAEQLRLEDLAERERRAAAPAVPPGGLDVVAVGEATLRTLPGSDGVHLAWDDPDMGSHLGAVFLDQSTEIMISSRRLATTPERTASVVQHEITHVYQARIIAAEAASGGGWTASYRALKARLDEAFGGNGVERSADCVALRLGATWVGYGTDCAGGERQAAVDALLAGRMP